VTAIRAGERGPASPSAVARRAAPGGQGVGCRWLLAAAERAGLASGSARPPAGPVSDSRGRLPHIATCAPGTGTGSVRVAREFTLATLYRWGLAGRSEDIAIVVSELLTNALRHALPADGDPQPRRAIRLGMIHHEPSVLCAVADPGRTPPVLRAPGTLAETGRGLQIIGALSDRWGYTPLSDTGKVVWATFTAPLAPAR